ncbi:MAG: alpha-N-arabinofuranosidase, partial [Anaerolineae bacterium]
VEDDHSLIINVVNRHKDEAITTDIISCSGDFASEARAREVYREDLEEPYTYAKKDEYIPKVKTISTDKSTMTYSFPPHSFTQIVIGMNK